MTTSHRSAAGSLGFLLIASSVPAAAQVTAATASAPTPTPTPAPTDLPIPAAPVIVLPNPTPAARSTPAAVPRPAATRTPALRPSASPPAQPSATPTPRARASASPAAAPTAPLAKPSPVVTPAPAPLTRSPLPARDEGPGHYWLAALTAAVLALAALGWVLLRRRRADLVEPIGLEEEEGQVPAAPAAPRARLTLAFRPRRAGINLLSATSENEFVITNAGDAPATDVRLQVRLLSAHAAQDADLAAFYAEPIGRPSVPAFTLAPGEGRTVSAVAALPRDAIRSLTAAGRPMFVPIVAVNIVYASGAGEGQLAQAFAVGIERVDSPKLAPFWLDAPARTYDQVAARPHAGAIER